MLGNSVLACFPGKSSLFDLTPGHSPRATLGMSQTNSPSWGKTMVGKPWVSAATHCSSSSPGVVPHPAQGWPLSARRPLLQLGPAGGSCFGPVNKLSPESGCSAASLRAWATQQSGFAKLSSCELDRMRILLNPLALK